MMAQLRRWLVAGLLVWVPLGVTALIVQLMVDTMDRTLLLLPQNIRPEVLLGYRIPGLGLVLTLVVVIATGVVATNLFGRQLLHLWEAILHRIPVVRGIYGAVKQLTETLFSGSGKSFRKVVLVEYPHANSWTLAFLTGEGGGRNPRQDRQGPAQRVRPDHPESNLRVLSHGAARARHRARHVSRGGTEDAAVGRRGDAGQRQIDDPGRLSEPLHLFFQVTACVPITVASPPRR